jgi:hypothetical protein
MPLGTRQLFVYWRVDSADTAAALQALRDWQRSLRAQHPALRIQLYLRGDTRAGEATVMESYALDAPRPSPGIDTALQRRIEREGNAAVQQLLRGTRHVEVFDALGDA